MAAAQKNNYFPQTENKWEVTNWDQKGLLENKSLLMETISNLARSLIPKSYYYICW